MTEPGIASETMREPPALSTWRRRGEPMLVVMIVSSGARGSALDRAQHGEMRTATALQSGERLAQLRIRGLGMGLEIGGRRHDPAVDAVAALRHLLLDEG